MEQSNLRTETQRKLGTQLVVIDTKSMYCTEYEDRERIRTTAVVIDDETTREGMLETMEILRSEATLESRAIEKQADEVIRIMELRFGYADKEYTSWFKT